MKAKTPVLEIIDLHVEVDEKKILQGVNLTINEGEVHALMGRNGSGKSTLSYALMGHPKYKISQGKIYYKGQDLISLSTDERARAGMYLAFQYPVAIPGVSVSNFLRATVKAKRGGELSVKDFRKELKSIMSQLGVKDEFLSRYVNDGFSGGEKKRLEILHMALLKPDIALLDETDSGLDIDALKTVSDGINALATDKNAILLITHYQRMLDYVKPHFVHVMQSGKIVKSGSSELARELEAHGYEWINQENKELSSLKLSS